MPLKCKSIQALDDICQTQWQQLSAGNKYDATPFLSYPFLKALEQTQCVDGNSGWLSHHLVIYDEDAINKNTIVAFLPCYLKTHSYGEYVFDHAWANAYHHHQLPYYPKLVCCIPFTPVTGSRMLINQNIEITSQEIYQWLAAHSESIIHAAGASSLHYLFLPEHDSSELAKQKTKQTLLQRLSVQFVWKNDGYTDFDEFLAKMTSRKRRSIRKERSGVYKQGEDLQIKRFTGKDISKELMQDFYLCYQQTYLKRSGHTGYLNQAFFHQLLEQMPDKLLIVMTFDAGRCIASALFVYDDKLLAGRYWGALEDISGLHFECCYYQGIEFCIENNISTFNPGTQGEHKILRGFAPTYCYSNHHLLHPDFHHAVADFLSNEKIAMQRYKEQAESVLPFKQP
ncbi:N-acetyltransferase [Glaciecola sp. MH2013]|uniref:GNAT family N-acetyltransferase n=1 Tax=Glaciecola sp. MH2013 TaxID=2785524 RepID=UPI00189D54F8|nr:GNAT family N-acetyltransferase [Glaciecola sp. MH2013]MBF7072404.1 N-acetyltransferase [Glaciecola sp. MH2013]